MVVSSTYSSTARRSDAASYTGFAESGRRAGNRAIRRALAPTPQIVTS
jgi:hypothetical protein